MPKPSEHKTIQSRIIGYAEEIGWTFVPREEAERRHDFDPDASGAEDTGIVLVLVGNAGLKLV